VHIVTPIVQQLANPTIAFGATLRTSVGKAASELAMRRIACAPVMAAPAVDIT
jgi:hypothetical protein